MSTLTCPWCAEPILSHEPTAPVGGPPLHYECGLRSACGSVGHQARRCSCYGGDDEDPPGLTRRQAARAAMEFFLLNQGCKA